MRLLECLGAETGNFRSLRAEKEGWLDGAWGLIGEERNRERAGLKGGPGDWDFEAAGKVCE